MTKERMREMLEATPFRRFDIRLADGESIRVVSREFVALSPSGRTAVVFSNDDEMKIIDLLLVTSLQTANGKPTSPRKRR